MKLIRDVVSVCFILAVVLSPVFSKNDKPFSFAVLGDYGCGCRDQQLVANSMIAWHKKRPFQTVITVGDNMYGSALIRSVMVWQKQNRGGSAYWFPSRFDRYYQPLLDQDVKFYASLGNHDMETNQGKDIIDDEERFHISRKEGYYSFTPETDPSDLVTFFALKSNTLLQGDNDPAQVKWLQEELSENDSKWKIVYLHHPLYSSGGSHRSYSVLIKLLQPILVANGVRVVFAGHNHFYARIRPQQGITHFTVGGGGKDLRNAWANRRTARSVSSYHFMYCEVSTDRLEYWTIPPHGAILDHGTIDAR